MEISAKQLSQMNVDQVLAFYLNLEKNWKSEYSSMIPKLSMRVNTLTGMTLNQMLDKKGL